MRVPTLAVTLIVAALVPAAFTLAQPASPASPCVTCHSATTPGLVGQWKGSRHAAAGVSCLDCHQAGKDDPDAFEHHGATIATLVTPKDCAQCHEQEAAEVSRSYHATAGQILDSQDAYLAQVLAGEPAAVQGCESCHGTKVTLDPASPDRLAAKSWPNTGIGRINPDGSLGACTACHTRHAFSKAQARQPEACGKCHLGPDHPQMEIYAESKHGNVYATNVAAMNLASEKWVVGVDYTVAPTCATCHMSATRTQPTSHDVGRRIAWTLRPAISQRKADWQTKRAAMGNVCKTCHGARFVEGQFAQFDATVRLYDEKFARPATDIMKLIQSKHLLAKKASFANDIEWTYWELWHHEGRRARHGAAMMGPDYTWWHGFYEVAKHFYFEFLPQARAYNDPDVNALVDKVLADPVHAWMDRDTDDLRQAIRNGTLQQLYAPLFVSPGEQK